MSVSRETLELAERHGLGEEAAERFERLLAALESEPDPPTTIRTRAEALDGHLADSLSGLAAPQLPSAERIADIGSGAGFPGLPLAVALPGAEVDLVEAARRKCEVIERLAAAAGAGHARALPVRAEELASDEGRGRYDAVTARALAPLPVLAEYAAPLLREGGALVAWKGARDAEEERGAGEAARQLGLRYEPVLRVTPFAGARNRHLHVLVKEAPTPARFPRRPGMALKRPLG